MTIYVVFGNIPILSNKNQRVMKNNKIIERYVVVSRFLVVKKDFVDL